MRWDSRYSYAALTIAGTVDVFFGRRSSGSPLAVQTHVITHAEVSSNITASGMTPVPRRLGSIW